MFLTTSLWAAETDVPAEEQEFVSSYLIVVDPSPKISSAAGHAALRMVCPEYDMDFCFSVLSDVPEEDMNRLFITGKLQAGMIAMPTNQFTERYQAEGRGVCQYKLLLPDEVKRELWRALDNDVERGQTIIFDPMGWNCTSRIQLMLEQALDADVIEYQDMPKLMGHTFHDVVTDYDCANSWAKLFTMTITGSDADIILPMHDQIFIPTYMAEALQNATINGQPVLSKDAEWLVPSTGKPEPVFISTSWVLLILVVLCLLSWRFCMAAWLTLGLCITYLWLGTDLPHMSWTWLLLLFNPLLPLVFLTRRGSLLRKLVAASVALVICVGIFWPHTLMAPEYLQLASVFALRTIFTPSKTHRTMKHLFISQRHRLLLLALALMASVACMASGPTNPADNPVGSKYAKSNKGPKYNGQKIASSGLSKVYDDNKVRYKKSTVFKTITSATGNDNGHGYVDLGLPSGTKWATENLGSTLSSGKTATYNWGSTKTAAQDKNYAATAHSYSQIILTDDAARANWKGQWRIPTKDQANEVLKYCKLEEGSYNGNYGVKITGPNGNSIFLPAATSASEENPVIYYWLSEEYDYRDDYGAMIAFSTVYFDKLTCLPRTKNVPAMIRPVYYDDNGFWEKYKKDDSKKSEAIYDSNGSRILSTVKITKAPSSPTGYENGHGYVDLGLPSGTKWATTDIGASSPTEDGYSFRWGEVQPRSIEDVPYDKSNEELDELPMSKDAARFNWKGSWRIPSSDEYDELIENCTFLEGYYNNVYGMQVTGPNGNSIFLPAYKMQGGGREIMSWLRDKNNFNKDEAYIITFSYDSYNELESDGRSINRYTAIRPVCSATNVTSSKPSTSSNSGTTSSYNSGSNNSGGYTPYKYRKAFNENPNDECVLGLTAGYVQKVWEFDIDGHKQTEGMFDEDKFVNGIQAGITYDPQFGAGFGLHTGLFYEYFWANSDKFSDYYEGYHGPREYFTAKNLYSEHNLYLPLHLKFTANFSEYFQLGVFGGVGLDCIIGSNVYEYDCDDDDEELGSWSLLEEDDWDNPFQKRFNASWEVGASIRIKNVMFDFTTSHGLLNHAPSHADYKVYQSKPMRIGMTVFF